MKRVLVVRANSDRIAAWQEAARRDDRSFSKWAVSRLSSKLKPERAKTSQKRNCDARAPLIRHTDEDRDLWRSRAAEAGLKVAEWARQVLDHASDQENA